MKRRIGLLCCYLLLLLPLITLTVFANSPPSNTVGSEQLAGVVVYYFVL